MILFGSPTERLACFLHESRMKECWGNWDSTHRLRWPTTREQWVHYQHNPHGHIEQALAQAKALLKAVPDIAEHFW